MESQGCFRDATDLAPIIFRIGFPEKIPDYFIVFLSSSSA